MIPKRTFTQSDIDERVQRIAWFSNCGKPLKLATPLAIESVPDWPAAVASISGDEWGDVQLEAQNALTEWLHHHARDRYRKWNEIVVAFKKQTIQPYVLHRIRQAVPSEAVLASVAWDILGAGMEDKYLDTGHTVTFFLELLEVYEAGHFPCGWQGAWPRGALLVL